jgi:hypothetical protein
MSVARARRRPLLVLAVAACLAAGISGPLVTSASAAPPVKPPPPVKLEIISLLDTSVVTDGLPDTAPAANAAGFAIAGASFAVTVRSEDSTGAAAVVGKDTAITLSAASLDGVSALAGTLGGTVTGTLLKGKSQVVISGVTYSTAENIRVVATADPKAELAADDIPTSVLYTAAYDKNVGKNGKVDLAGCSLTPLVPTCVSLLLPDGATGPVLLSTGVCVGAGAGPCKTNTDGQTVRLVQALASLPATTNFAAPATMIVGCDKSICGQGGVTAFPLKVDIANNGTFVTPDPCPAKGVIGENQIITGSAPKVGRACIDYRQSTRDNAGDLFTYLLFDYDIKAIH